MFGDSFIPFFVIAMQSMVDREVSKDFVDGSENSVTMNSILEKQIGDVINQFFMIRQESSVSREPKRGFHHTIQPSQWIW
jgi:hypothetical protein